MKRIIILSSIAALAFIILFIARASLTPLFWGIAFAYVLMPMVKGLEAKGVKRYFALVCVYLIVVMVIFAVFWIGIPFLVSAIKAFQFTLSDYLGGFEMPFNVPGNLESILTQFGTSVFKYIGNAANALVSTISALINIAIGLVLSFYMIVDREKIRESLLRLIPKSWHKFLLNVIRSVDIVVKQFLIGQLGVALVMSALLFAGLAVLKVEHALLLAILGGLFEVIPYFGAFLGAIPAVIIAAIDSPQKAIWTAVLFTAVQQIEGAYISPKILGSYVGLHPIITIMAVIVGGHLFGFAGMILAVPACGIIRSIAGEIVDALEQYD